MQQSFAFRLTSMAAMRWSVERMQDCETKVFLRRYWLRCADELDAQIFQAVLDRQLQWGHATILMQTWEKTGLPERAKKMKDKLMVVVKLRVLLRMPEVLHKPEVLRSQVSTSSSTA
jgi:hypothetical protein